MESSTRSASVLVADPLPTAPFNREARSAAILGVGHYVPERVLTNHDLEAIVDTSDEWIVSRTGISERRIAAPGQTTTDLGYEAAVAALADAGLSAADIDLIIVATATADAAFPSTACSIQHRLGARAAAFDLGAACSGFVYALAVGAQFIETGAYRHVLVIGAETLSRIVNWRDRATCVLFGDGAGAVVLTAAQPGEGMLAFELGADGSGSDLLAIVPGGGGHPLTTGSDAEREQSIVMNGREVYKFACRVVEESTLRVLRQAGLTTADIDCLIPHQANIRIIDSAAQRLGLNENQLFNNVSRYGNTSAASIPIALSEAVQAGRLQPGDTVVLVGFGGGLSWASCVLNWTGTAKQGRTE